MTFEDAKKAFLEGKKIKVSALGNGQDMPFGVIAEPPRESEQEKFLTSGGVIVTEQLVKVEGIVRLYKRQDIGKRRLIVPLSKVKIW